MLFNLRFFFLGWQAALYLAFITIFFNVQQAHSIAATWHANCMQSIQRSNELLQAMTETLDLADYGYQRLLTVENPQYTPAQQRTFRTFVAYFTNILFAPNDAHPLHLIDPNAVGNARFLQGKSPTMTEIIR
jgi:hypothetical protein